jgi:hypothetical protein
MSDTLTTATAAQAAVLNAINSATADAIRYAEHLQDKVRLVIVALRSGSAVSDFGLSREAHKVDMACAHRRQALELGPAVGCDETQFCLAAKGNRSNYFLPSGA